MLVHIPGLLQRQCTGCITLLSLCQLLERQTLLFQTM
uniref:Uncharacterized protein n=1 Tax=Arundo donax TaxID=35708 RepID=A0A0A9GHA6_ARUDO